MKLGRVVGTVTSTLKAEGISGAKTLMVELDSGSVIVAVDTVGAGVGEHVLVASGSAARCTQVTQSMPVDDAIIAIVDAAVTKGNDHAVL